jgi:3-phosphoshikimate 1-carboxyvinyltransferase
LNIAIHKPLSPVSGNIQLPGSKSISNRVLVIKALSGLAFEIENVSGSDDTKHLEKAIELLRQNNSGTINVGHAGTDMRFLTALLAIQAGSYELTGSERMQQRPIKELVNVLKELGADITYKKETGYPPLLINGKKIAGGKAEIIGNVSSQFISSLLLVAPYFTNGLELAISGNMVSRPYVHMTVELMKTFGAQVTWNENTIAVKPVPYTYSRDKFIIECDWSAASYYYSIIALSPLNTSLTLSGLFKASLQADAVCKTSYESLGVETQHAGNEISITKMKLPDDATFKYDFINCPDIAQTLACTCIGLNQAFIFTGLHTLKVKETNRIEALKNELEKFGLEIIATENSLECTHPKKTGFNNAIEVSTYNDHRMAMSFAPLCLVTDRLIIQDMNVVSKSYPQFWHDLIRIGFIINEQQI